MWIEIFIVLVILGIHIKIEKLSTGKRSMHIRISGWCTFEFGCVRSLFVTGWHRWRSGRMWCQFCCWLSMLLWCRCSRAFAPPACLGIRCCAMFGKKAAILLIYPKHSRVSFHCSLHIFLPRKLNFPLLLFSDSSPRFLDQVMHCLHRGARKPPLGYCGHIQGKAHVGLF